MSASPDAPRGTAAGLPAAAALRAELPGLPRDADGPVFRAPWEAQAFAMALALHERGNFTWKEWAQTLAAVIAEVRQRGEPDTGEEYYRHWLTALERISESKGLVNGTQLSQRKEAWEEAARRTPHGQPIELRPSETRRHAGSHRSGEAAGEPASATRGDRSS